MWNILYTAFDIVPYPKGASTHILQFIRGLVNAGHKVHLITPGDGILPDEDILEGAQVTRIPLNPEAKFLERALTFDQAVMEHVAHAPPYDMAHYRSLWGGLHLAQEKLLYGYKTLFEVNGLPSVELKYHYPGLEGSNLFFKIREQELAALTLSDRIVCPSGVTRAFITSLGIARDHVRVIPNGYSPHNFVSDSLSTLEANPIPTILYVGTLADWQGLQTLIQAMPIMLAEKPVRLQIVGSGRGRQSKTLSKMVRKLGLEEAIELKSAIPHHEIYNVIASADVCVAPLGYNDRNVTQGCCPIKVIEYMGASKPIVASNLPVVRELVQEDVDALLFSPDDPNDLARQILRLLNDPSLAQRISTHAAERARLKFTWQAAQKKLLEVYKELLN